MDEIPFGAKTLAVERVRVFEGVERVAGPSQRTTAKHMGSTTSEQKFRKTAVTMVGHAIAGRVILLS